MRVPIKKQKQRLVVDAFGCKASNLDSVEFACSLLEALSQIVDSHTVHAQLDTNNDCVIKSTISWFDNKVQLCIYPKHHSLTLDILSCKLLDSELIQNFVIDKAIPDRVVVSEAIEYHTDFIETDG